MNKNTLILLCFLMSFFAAGNLRAAYILDWNNDVIIYLNFSNAMDVNQVSTKENIVTAEENPSSDYTIQRGWVFDSSTDGIEEIVPSYPDDIFRNPSTIKLLDFMDNAERGIQIVIQYLDNTTGITMNSSMIFRFDYIPPPDISCVETDRSCYSVPLTVRYNGPSYGWYDYEVIVNGFAQPVQSGGTISKPISGPPPEPVFKEIPERIGRGSLQQVQVRVFGLDGGFWSDYTGRTFDLPDLPVQVVMPQKLDYYAKGAVSFEPMIPWENLKEITVSGDIAQPGNTLTIPVEVTIPVESYPILFENVEHDAEYTIQVRYQDDDLAYSPVVSGSVPVPTGSAYALAESTAYASIGIIFDPGIPYTNLKKITVTGDVDTPEGKLEINKGFFPPANKPYFIAMHEHDGNGTYRINIVYTDDFDVTSNITTLVYSMNIIDLIKISVDSFFLDQPYLTLYSSSSIQLQEMEISGDITDTFCGVWLPYEPAIDLTLTPENGEKIIRIRFRDLSGFVTDYEEIKVRLLVNRTCVEVQNNVIDRSMPEAQVAITTQEVQDVEIKIYELTGELIKTLWEGSHQGGILTLSWDGTNEGGSRVAKGVYLMLIKNGDHAEVKEIVVEK